MKAICNIQLGTYAGLEELREIGEEHLTLFSILVRRDALVPALLNYAVPSLPLPLIQR